MKTILLASLMLALSAPINARADTLQGIAARCVLDGISPDAPNASAVSAPYHLSDRWGAGTIAWSYVEEALYCPNTIDRADSESAHWAEEAKARFDADLRRYGE
jgi:hypothetical protein